MKQIRYKDLSWPQGLNLDHLVELLPEDVLRAFIAAYARFDRKQRRIVLPSAKCCRKVIAHYLWKQVLAGETTWEEEKESLRKEFGQLADIKMTRSEVIRLYEQREKEIAKEQQKKRKRLHPFTSMQYFHCPSIADSIIDDLEGRVI